MVAMEVVAVEVLVSSAFVLAVSAHMPKSNLHHTDQFNLPAASKLMVLVSVTPGVAEATEYDTVVITS